MAAVLVLWFGGALAAETGSTRTDSELMAAPYRDAKSMGNLAGNTKVEVLERRGAWIRVKATDKDGWVRLHQVRLGEGAEQKGSSGLGALWNVGTTGRSGTQGIVATTGVRGMSADQLKSAKPDPKEFEKLERYRTNDEQARDLAKSGGLKEKDVAFLPKPN
ncbi:MAG TPA: SH3 domain-containing protein [Burkholderiales bacterium]|nr:SH3 domain-containing protein [Burkholderiales bacterium]